MRELAKKEAHVSYREKIEGVNKRLENLPEHNDLFRISYAGTG
jgi:hypothetical protein